MTAAERRTYSDKYVQRVNKLQAFHQRKILAELQRQAAGIAAIVAANGAQAGINAVQRIHTTAGMPNILRRLHIQTGLVFANKAFREIRASARRKVEKGPTFGFNEKWTADILNFFRTDLFRTVSRITETTRQMLLAVIQKGIEQGWGIEKMVKDLKSPELMAWRARLIARTEIAKASNAALEISDNDSEWETQKEWISARDHRVRDAHRTADGQVVDGGAKFVVGADYMTGPGDPTASLANICNCRCVAAITAKRDAAGRLIPKRISGSTDRVAVIRPGDFNRPASQPITIPRPAATVIQPGSFTRPGQTIITIGRRTGTDN